MDKRRLHHAWGHDRKFQPAAGNRGGLFSLVKRHRRDVMALKTVYDAVDDKAAEVVLTAFETGPWGKKYTASGRA